ncbi:MAG: AAA family ATPase [Actinomycetota bacterium]
MFLRSLTLKGFKSFAEKTSLEFAPGVSVIVGPNGSGKSNLVDAIAWVLGEQGPRSLRGGQMADVIFAGSPKRPPLGMAEVNLVIDNEAGKIPVPMSELEISRTIFRSGDSEYRIGGELARLMDIQELLSDSGIGRALHTVVGQGQLEDVLTSRPEDRRQYVEEAAGIAKHRRRKERAQRKLGSLEQDLLRLKDVLGELRRQLKPLKQQAEVAQRHEQLERDADDLSVRLAAARLRDLRATRDDRRPAWDEGLERRRQAKERIGELDASISEMVGRREKATHDLADAEARLQGAQVARAAAEIAVREADKEESAARSKLATEAVRSVRLSALDEEIAAAEEGQGDTRSEIQLRETELLESEQRFREAEARRREAEEERRRLAEEAAAHRAEMETLRRSLAAYEHERERLEETLAGVRDRIDASEAERGELKGTIERLDSDATPLTERRSSLEKERDSLRSEETRLADEARRLESGRDLLEARLGDLQETPGRRFAERHKGRAIGLLGELISVETKLEPALRAALGPLADAVVYRDEDAAIADAPGGEGALLVIARGEPQQPSLSEERSLLSVIDSEPRARGLAAEVLADVYLVANLDEAVDKHRRHPESAFVTQDGAVVGPMFIHTASDPVARRKALAGELGSVRSDLESATDRLASVRSRLAKLEDDAVEVSTDLERADMGITSAAERMAHVESDLAAARKEEEFLTQRLTGLDDAADAWRKALAAAGPAREELPAMPPEVEAPMGARVAVEALRREAAGIDARLDRLRSDRRALLTETPDLLRAALENAETKRRTAEAELEESAEAYEQASGDRDAAAVAEREGTASEAEANREWRDAAAELERLREEYEEEDRVRGDLERRISEAERLVREGHGKDPEEVLSSLTDQDSVQSLERKQELVSRRMGLLGRVNLLAGGEFEALQERHDFLQREIDDVKKARRDLMHVIHRVDEEVVALFDSAYEDVSNEFERLFKSLFPDGEGRLVLTDPANLLETGIEIEARPGRKRVKRISLLSGGERALTALCFLFSIFKARPSPFYLLDEVEPALDDVNLLRFLELIKNFASESQVIIVTHQKRTMEAASVMYGVSMGKDGFSRVLAQKMEDTERSDTPPTPAPAPAETPESEPVG